MFYQQMSVLKGQVCVQDIIVGFCLNFVLGAVKILLLVIKKIVKIF